MPNEIPKTLEEASACIQLAFRRIEELEKFVAGGQLYPLDGNIFVAPGVVSAILITTDQPAASETPPDPRYLVTVRTGGSAETVLAQWPCENRAEAKEVLERLLRGHRLMQPGAAPGRDGEA